MLLAFASKAVWVAVLIGLSKSLVLFTLPKPTLVGLIPEAIFASVMAPVAIAGLEAVPVKSPANLILPFANEVASAVMEAST